MTKNPEQKSVSSQPIETGLTVLQVREAISKWEERAGLEIGKLRSQTPGWSPLMDKIRIGGSVTGNPRRIP